MKKIAALLLSLSVIFLASCKDITVTNSETNVTDAKHNSAPYIVSATVDELRAIKNAIYTMQEDEFKAYMYKNHYGAIANGMYTIENAKFLMEEFEATMIPVLDGDETCFKKLLFYHERNEIQCVIPYTESIAMTFNIYTPKSDRKESGVFGTSNNNAVLQKELNFDNILMSVYRTDTDDEFFVDVFADNTYIFVRTTGVQDIEDFEECFSRLEFVKIGDLLNEMPVKTSEVETTEENITVQEELYSVGTTLPEPTYEITEEQN